MTLRSTVFSMLGLAVAAACNPPPPASPDEVVGCTEEAKVCPDGSSVVRSGPDCDFPACPNADPDNGISPDPAPAGPDGDASPQPMGTFEADPPPG